jgi:hypothetical protein
MAESSQYWSGIAYTDDQFSDNWALLHTYDRATQGVIATALAAYNGNLEVTPSVGTNVTMAKGAALVDGKVYRSTGNINFTCVAPGAGSNFYTIMLRKTWISEDVLATFLGPNPVAPPAITQNDGVVWDLQIATVEITSLGVITITDSRKFIGADFKKKLLFFDFAGYYNTVTTNWEDVNPHRDTPITLLDTYGGQDVISYFNGEFIVPPDFISGLTASPIVYGIIDSPGFMDVRLSLSAEYSAIGEAYNTHTDTDAQTETLTATIVTKTIELSVANASVGDVISFTGFRDASHADDNYPFTVYLLGVLIEYLGVE